MSISNILSFLGLDTIPGIFMFLGTVAIIIAAFTISSSKTINPKIRIWAFISYIGACIFLGIYGVLTLDLGGDWMIIQQVVLFFINCRGIYNARKELKTPKRDPFKVIVPSDFWEDILDGEGMDHEY